MLPMETNQMRALRSIHGEAESQYQTMRIGCPRMTELAILATERQDSGKARDVGTNPQKLGYSESALDKYKYIYGVPVSNLGGASCALHLPLPSQGKKRCKQDRQ